MLKQKFDDIFASTRYVKALDNIRKFRMEQVMIKLTCSILCPVIYTVIGQLVYYIDLGQWPCCFV